MDLESQYHRELKEPYTRECWLVPLAPGGTATQALYKSWDYVYLFNAKVHWWCFSWPISSSLNKGLSDISCLFMDPNAVVHGPLKDMRLRVHQKIWCLNLNTTISSKNHKVEPKKLDNQKSDFQLCAFNPSESVTFVSKLWKSQNIERDYPGRCPKLDSVLNFVQLAGLAFLNRANSRALQWNKNFIPLAVVFIKPCKRSAIQPVSQWRDEREAISLGLAIPTNATAFSHRELKLDGAIGDFAEPLWRLKTGHFTTYTLLSFEAS